MITFKRAVLFAMLASVSVPLAGCVVYENRGPSPYAGAVWVPGHYGPGGFWVRGHWA